MRIDAGRECCEAELGINIARHLGHDLDLLATDRRQSGAHLAVEIGDFEFIQIGDIEPADAEPGQNQQMGASHPAHSGDGDRLAA